MLAIKLDDIKIIGCESDDKEDRALNIQRFLRKIVEENPRFLGVCVFKPNINTTNIPTFTNKANLYGIASTFLCLKEVDFFVGFTGNSAEAAETLVEALYPFVVFTGTTLNNRFLRMNWILEQVADITFVDTDIRIIGSL